MTERRELEGPSVPELRFLTVGALVASVLARGVAPTLPGSAVGSDTLVTWVVHAGAFCSQLVALVGAATLLRLLPGALVALRSQLLRSMLLLSGGAVLGGVLWASSQPLDRVLQSCLLLAVTVLGAVALPRALRWQATRGLALVLVLSLLGAATTWAAAELTRVPDSVGWLQALGIAAALVDCCALGIGGFWAATRRRVGASSVVLALVVVLLFALRYIEPEGGASWRTLAQRGLEAFVAAPVGDVFPAAVALGLAAAAVLVAALSATGGAGHFGPALGLAVIGRVSGGGPLGALLLTLSALVLLRAAVAGGPRSVPPAANRPAPHPSAP